MATASSTPVVLLVEDSAEQRLLLREFLADILTADFCEAADADTGYAHVRARTPDLVLLDLHVPPHGGLALLHALRADPALRHVQVIVLSGSRRPEDLAVIAAAAPCRFIEKPYDLDVLEAAILECLQVGAEQPR